MHEVLVNRLGGLSLPRKSVVRLTDRPDMTLDVYRGRKTTMQSNNTREFNRRCPACNTYKIFKLVHEDNESVSIMFDKQNLIILLLQE